MFPKFPSLTEIALSLTDQRLNMNNKGVWMQELHYQGSEGRRERRRRSRREWGGWSPVKRILSAARAASSRRTPRVSPVRIRRIRPAVDHPSPSDQAGTREFQRLVFADFWLDLVRWDYACELNILFYLFWSPASRTGDVLYNPINTQMAVRNGDVRINEGKLFL